MTRIILLVLAFAAVSPVVAAEKTDAPSLEQQFRGLPVEARRLTGPLFWLHGDESPERLQMYVGKVAEGGNGCFTAESRPHNDWLGPGWFRDLAICLEAAKQHNLQMWIFDEKWWPSQGVAGRVPPRWAAKRLAAALFEADGPRAFTADGCAGERYVAAVAGRVAADGRVDGGSLIDLAPHIQNGKLTWQVPHGKWQIVKFTHVQGPALAQNRQLSVDGASKDCVDWFIKTVYQPHYDKFGADFGKTIPGFFYDEPETRGDWGTEVPVVLAEWGVDWKKAYVAYKVGLSGEEDAAAKYQYRQALAEAWGRTMYGGTTRWCRERGVKSIGHFMEHGYLYVNPEFCAGDMMMLQRYSDMGAIDAVFKQFAIGRRTANDRPTWQTPKLASSISHVCGKEDDLAMVEIFGARGQDLSYLEMKWWANHMQVSGVNFMIPHAFNPRAPYDHDCPPYFYNGGFEPRWPLYRVWADYSSRLSLVLSGGRHVCPVALLFSGNLRQVGKAVMPEQFSEALQDAQLDCDWLPMDSFEREAKLDGRNVALHQERYQVLVVPPVEVIPYGTLVKAKEFFERGGIVVGYGFVPSKSGTIGKSAAQMDELVKAIWGGQPKPGPAACKTSPAGGQAYLLDEKPTPAQLKAALVADAKLQPGFELTDGPDDGWLHVLHRQKAGRDVFLIANQNTSGTRKFTFRLRAAGEPECWDAQGGEIAAPQTKRIDARTVELTATLEPVETLLIVFNPQKTPRPPRIEGEVKPTRAFDVVRLPSQPVPIPTPMKQRPLTLGPLKAADPLEGRCELTPEVDLAKSRVYLEMTGLPGDAAAVTVNGQPAGGVIGKPWRVDVTRLVKPGENKIRIEPLAPKAARLVVY